jgi:hypothetical protein
MADCMSSGCTNHATFGWQRWATEAEIIQFHGTGDLPQSETEARIPRYACDDHKVTVAQAGYTHDSTCAAPSPCDCSIKDKPEYIGPLSEPE